MAEASEDLVLYTYFRSSCSARLRIALNLKNIPYTSKYVNILKNEQSSPEYDAVNPSHLVPSLRHVSADITITQSVAALEYLEERFPDHTPLLPPASDTTTRAHVRTLVDVIACDTQPVTNMRILTRIAALGGTREQWARELTTEELIAYERLAKRTAGKFSVGDEITLADICLVPAVWGAQRWGVDLQRLGLETVSRVFENMEEVKAVNKAKWDCQEDTPEELRRAGEPSGTT
ncbi:maleylacetoacetate isomerase [Rhizodiscina lignyota]|uniref:Maleylacetoacetate isomerase n=1 Tax=Rhizodiscina lignyota TaxID=1504668 RepID=A0A9P4I6R9_9PEZI|nr:maleylacetoacetate isomerase [Rhizodiscina lignyota]